MKNLKKVLSVLLVVAVLATAMVPAFAATTFTYESQAKALYDIGLFKGTSTTEFVPDLGGDLVREQGIAMIVRLLGKADAAAAVTVADQDAALAAFADAKDVEPTLKAAVAYAVKNNLVKGDGKNVDPKGKMPGKDFATILLRNLGYEVSAADYDKACATLVEKGGLTAAEAVKFSEKNLIRDDFVGMSYGALQAAYKDGATVIAKLITDKVVDQAKAIAVGVYKPVTGDVTATVVGAKKFNLAFSAAIDPTKVTASAITVKKGSSTYTIDNVKVAEDKKSAVVTITSPIVKGDYEISVTGIVADKAVTAKVTAENERVEKIEFPSENAVLKSATDFSTVIVNYKILNQYKEDITSKKYSAVSFTGNKGIQTVNDGKLTYSVSGSTFVMGEKLSVTATYLDTDNNGQPVFASAILTVSQMAQVGEIAIPELYNDNKAELAIGGNYEEFFLLVDAKDQYGNKVPVDNLGEAVVAQTTDASVVKFVTKTISGVETPVFKEITINGVKRIALALKAPDTNARAGKADIIIVSKANGKSAKYTVTVKDSQKIDTLSLQIPEFAVAGEVVKIPFTAVDAEGKEITKLSGLKMNADKSVLSVSGISGVSEAKFEMDPVTNKPVLTLDATKLTEKATAYISGLTATYKPVNLTVTLQDRPKLDTLNGIKSDYKTNILLSNTVAFNFDKVLVQDSYGRSVSKDTLVTSKYDFGTKYRYTVESSNADKIELQSTVGGTTYYQELGAGEIKFFAKAKGSSTITVKLQKNEGTVAAPSWKDVTDTSFSVTAVEPKSIESYKVSTIDAIYTLRGADDLYATEVKVTGVLANGKEVEIPKSKFNVSTSSNLVYGDSTSTIYGKLAAADNTKLASDKEEDATFVVSIPGEKPGTISSKTKVSGKLPVATTLSVQSTGDGRSKVDASYVKEADTVVSMDWVDGKTKTEADVKAQAMNIVKVVDQYGKTVSNASFITSVSVDSVKNNNGDYVTETTYNKGYSLYVTAVTKDGAVFSFTLAINN